MTTRHFSAKKNIWLPHEGSFFIIHLPSPKSDLGHFSVKKRQKNWQYEKMAVLLPIICGN